MRTEPKENAREAAFSVADLDTEVEGLRAELAEKDRQIKALKRMVDPHVYRIVKARNRRNRRRNPGSSH